MNTEILTKELINAAVKGNDWDLGNKVLYDLCKEHPRHKSKPEIVAKIWLIGRAYAAAIERTGKKSDDVPKGDDFYLEHVASAVKASNMDQWLERLKNCDKVTVDNLDVILGVHQKVTDLFHEISGRNKRSLASKYLHFHYPGLFFIYDDRVLKALSKLSHVTGRLKRTTYEDADNDYRKVCEKCLKVRDHIEKTHKIFLSPRHLDNLLLEIYATSNKS